MTHVDCSHNRIAAVPPEIARVDTLEVLRLAHNDLAGPLPPELFALLHIT